MPPAAAHHKKPTNGQQVPDEAIRSQWPGLAAVCQRLHMPIARVQELVRDGHLRTYQAFGTARFNPDEVEAFSSALSEVPSDEDAEDRKAARAGMPAEGVRATGDLLRQVTTALKESHELCMQLHKLNMDSWIKANDAQDRAFTRMLDRCTKYEAVIDQYLDAREEQFSAQALRDMAKDTNQATLRRRDEMWQTTKTQFTKLADIIAKRVGFDEITVRKLTLVNDLLATMPRVQLEVLLESGFLNDSQKETIKQFLDLDKPPPGPAAQAAPSDPAPAPSAGPAATAETESTNA